MVVIDHKVIIEIAAHLARGPHIGVQAKVLPAAEFVEILGELAGLDLFGHVELGADAFLFRGDALDLLDVQHRPRGELGKGLGQDLDLVAGFIDVLHPELAVADAERGHAPGDGVERVDDPVGDGGRKGHACRHDRGHRKDQDVSGMEHLPVEGGDGTVLEPVVLFLQAVVGEHLRLFLVDIADQLLHAGRLEQIDRRVGRNDQQDRDQQHAEDLSADAAAEKIVRSSHGLLLVMIRSIP